MSDTGPSGYFAPVTPSESATLTQRIGHFPRALRVGTGGDIVIEGADGTTATFKNVSDGETLPVWAKRVLSTGTTAADIVALY